MNDKRLITTAKAMVAEGKGLLAMDESTLTCNKRFSKLGIPQTEEAHRSYREMIVTTPGLGESISGVIRHVMSGVNPQGCEVFSFKQPTTDGGDYA